MAIFEQIFEAKVLNKALNPPQGYTKESFDKLNKLIVEEAGHYGGKIKAQGSKLMGASDVDEAGNFISDLDYVCEVDAKRFLEILAQTFEGKLEPIYKTAFKTETVGSRLSAEQMEKLLTFAKNDLLRSKGERVLTGKSRDEIERIILRNDEGLIFNDKLRLVNGNPMTPFLDKLVEEFGDVEFTVKRIGGYNDGPFIEIN